MKRHETDDFLKGYLDAALFTTDTNPPGGCDYVACGRAEEMFPSLPDWFIEQARQDCAGFQAKAGELLEKAGTDEQNGADFWFSRNGHGVGFWDRGYPDEIGDGLHDIAAGFRTCDLTPEDIGQQSELCNA